MLLAGVGSGIALKKEDSVFQKLFNSHAGVSLSLSIVWKIF